jgi:hypothetical protein
LKWNEAWRDANFLQCLHLPKSEHRPLSSSKWQVAVLKPVVRPPTHLTAVEIAKFSHRCGAGALAMLAVRGQVDPFLHRDRNTLFRVADPEPNPLTQVGD